MKCYECGLEQNSQFNCTKVVCPNKENIHSGNKTEQGEDVRKEVIELKAQLGILLRLRAKLGGEEILHENKWITIDEMRDIISDKIKSLPSTSENKEAVYKQTLLAIKEELNYGLATSHYKIRQLIEVAMSNKISEVLNEIKPSSIDKEEAAVTREQLHIIANIERITEGFTDDANVAYTSGFIKCYKILKEGYGKAIVTPISEEKDTVTEVNRHVNYFHTVCDNHEFVECETSYTTNAGITTTKAIQCRFCGCLKPTPVPEEKEVVDHEKEERGLENKFVELIHDCKPFLETVEGCVKIAKEYASRQMSYPSDQWIKVTPETMPTTQVLLLTSSQVVIIGDWYKGEWRTHRSEWVPIEGSEFKRLKSAFKFEEIIAWMPLPKTPYEIEIDYNYPDECGNEWVEAKETPFNLMAVLLLNVREGVFKFCEEGYWSEETRNYHTYHGIAENVTHWKLLPSLPGAIRPEQHSNPKVDAIRKAWKKSPSDSNSKVKELIEWLEGTRNELPFSKEICDKIKEKANSLIQQDK